jgi:hypothetical protein
LEELGVDGRTVLYYIKELDVRMWSGLVWLRKVSRGGLCTSGSHTPLGTTRSRRLAFSKGCTPMMCRIRPARPSGMHSVCLSVSQSVSQAELCAATVVVATKMLIRQFRNIVAIISNKKWPWQLKFLCKQIRKLKFNGMWSGGFPVHVPACGFQNPIPGGKINLESQVSTEHRIVQTVWQTQASWEVPAFSERLATTLTL